MEKINYILRRERVVSIVDMTSTLSFICLCVFYFDCCVFGGGRHIMIGALSARMLFALLAAIFCMPELILNIRKHLRNPIFYLFALFVICLVVNAFRGYASGYRMEILKTDIKGYCWLFLIPTTISTIHTKERFAKLMHVLVAGAVVQAVGIIIINGISAWITGINIPINGAFRAMLIGNVDYVSDSIFRIFIKSMPYLVTACSVVLFRQVQKEKLKISNMLIMGVFLNALLFSYTRSVYGCIFVVFVCSAIIVYLLYRSKHKLLFQFVFAGALTVLLFVVIQEFIFGGSYVNFAVSRLFGCEFEESLIVRLRNAVIGDTVSSVPNGVAHYTGLTVESDRIRSITQKELIQLIHQNPLFGNGLGTAIPSRGFGHNEYFYLDTLAKVGVLGLFLYILPFGYILTVCWIKRDDLSQCSDGCAAICGMMGFWAITWFNPWMNAVLGIAMYALCSTLPTVLQNHKYDTNKGENAL